MNVEAIWLRRLGDKTQVLLEKNGRWYLVIEEYYDGSFSHIAEQPVLWTCCTSAWEPCRE